MEKIIVASDSFKGCMSSSEIGERIAITTRKLFPEVEVTVLPISDGGRRLSRSRCKKTADFSVRKEPSAIRSGSL